MKTIKIDKDYFKKFDCKIKIPMITCRICGKKILDTPTNRLKYA